MDGGKSELVGLQMNREQRVREALLSSNDRQQALVALA